MNSQNSSHEIQYPQELDIRIAELEKELAPFLNTQNLAFTLKEILASATGSVSKILGVTSCSNVDNIINYIDKYNEYVKLLKERNEFLSGTTNNLAYNYEIRIQKLTTIKTNLEKSELNLRKKVLGLEKEVEKIKDEKNELKAERDKIADGLKRAVAKIKSNIIKYREYLSEKNEDIRDLNELLKETDLLDKKIKAENIEDLYERIRYLESADSQNKHFQKVIADLQINKENLTRENEKLKMQLLEKIAEIFSRLASFNKDFDIGDTINILDGMLKDSNTENLKLQINLSEKDRRIQELEKQLAESNEIRSFQQKSLDAVIGVVEMATIKGNNTILVEDINSSIKPANNPLSLHPSHVAKIYDEHDNHHKKIIHQASNLEQLIANHSK